MPIERDGEGIIEFGKRLFGGGGGGDAFVYTGGGGKAGKDERKGPGKPLGVSSEYTVPAMRRGTYSPVGGQTAVSMGRAPGTMGVQRPRYFSDDIMRPANAAPASIAEIQRYLMVAGLLPDKPQGGWEGWGVWDPKTQSAWRNVLEYANARGIRDRDALMELANAAMAGGMSGEGTGGEDGGGGGGGGMWTIDENGNPVFTEAQFVAPPMEIRLPNKKDVERAFRTASIDYLGGSMSAAQISAMADAYLAKVREPQEAAYRSQVQNLEAEFYGRPPPNKEITQVEAMSPETFAEQDIRRRDPAGFQAGQFAEDYAPAFFDALGGYV